MVTKRGQVALFLILGIIVIMFVAFYLYQVSVSTDNEIAIEELSAGGNFNKKAFESYMKGCIEKTLTRGVYLMGERGGFLDDTQMPFSMEFGQKYVQGGQPIPKLVPTYAFWHDDPGSEANSHLWYHSPDWEDNAYPDLEHLHTALPTPQYMDEALRSFVAQNLEECVDPQGNPDSYMNELRNMVDIVEPTDFTYTVDDINLTFRDQDIIIIVNKPVVVLDGPDKHEIRQFQGRTQIALFNLYNVALWFNSNMMNAQKETITITDVNDQPVDMRLGYVLDSDECARYEQASGESTHLLNGQTNIYVLYKDDNQGDYVVRFVDFRPKFIKYRAPFIFQFAIDANVGEISLLDVIIRGSSDPGALNDPDNQLLDAADPFNPARSIGCVV